MLKAVWLCFAFLSCLAHADCTLETSIEGVIGPATLDLLNRIEAKVRNENCGAALLLINTPGGSLESTHLIVEKILNFPVPVLCLVAPTGAHAGSAGAIILQACHVNGAMHGTNLGAATPIGESGADIPKDLRRKILNDTQSWLAGVVELRGRNRKFATAIIEDAKSVTAEEAARIQAIDIVTDDVPQFLKFASGKTVKMTEGNTAVVSAGVVQKMELDARFRVLEALTDPQFTYLLFLASLGLLYFEFTHPGAFVAGVTGAIGLIISLIAFHKLQVEWAGVALIVLGSVLLVAELFISSFGAFGIGGLVSFVLGSLFLFDPEKTGYRLSLFLIGPVALVFAALILALGFLMLRTRRLAKKGGFEELFGRPGTVVRVNGESNRTGLMEVRGETWAFQSTAPIRIGDRVRVVGHEGMVLYVERNEPES